MKFLSASEKQTFNFAKNSAKKLKGGEVIGLIGNLGAGKTVFAKGLAAGLAVKRTVTSPTFVLMKVYPLKARALKHFVHIDAYRVKSAEDLTAIGAREYFGRSDTVSLIEWADKIKRILPGKTKFVKIDIRKSQRLINY